MQEFLHLLPPIEIRIHHHISKENLLRMEPLFSILQVLKTLFKNDEQTTPDITIETLIDCRDAILKFFEPFQHISIVFCSCGA